MKKIVSSAVSSRLNGDRPSPPKAFAVAFVVGAAVATTTYRALRS
jgi:hypothetical protein